MNDLDTTRTVQVAPEQNQNPTMGNKKTEKAPLITQRRILSNLEGSSGETTIEMPNDVTNRTLGTFVGVFAPVCLSQISTLLFLRLGFIVGNQGLLMGITSLILAYGILGVTILSVCAICTNGAVEGGGAYFMISRTLGPEFGGAIGTLFFFANVFSSALYATGCVEGIVGNFGAVGNATGAYSFLPDGAWYNFLYASVVNISNLLVCLIGAKMFAKTTTFILSVVLTCTLSVFISYLVVQYAIEVPIPEDNMSFLNVTANYTGFSLATLKQNMFPNYVTDYTTDVTVDFATAFGVLFTGVTGIMAGANMSGELKSPGVSIPKGTGMASLFTFVTYLILLILTAATTSRDLLQNNYMFMTDVNIWPPFVTIGVITATLSASLSNIIGASRILAALVKDNLYGRVTKWIEYFEIGANPIGAVLVSAVCVEAVLLIGKLNTIARFTSVLFLLSYFGTNLACFCLEWASAPNFRPTFTYFALWTALLGIISNAIMMFITSAIASAICIMLCLVLFIIIHVISPPGLYNWGSISQALIFHQVRKYLLMLDSRKDHVKFWRPQMLLLVANPRSACPLIDFVNDLKKSGLYVIGHVKVDKEDDKPADTHFIECSKWQSLVDHLKVKAFIEVTTAHSIKAGIQQLSLISGLGAMKPNTIVLGFHDSAPAEDFFNKESTPFHVTSSERRRNSDTMKVLAEWYRESTPIEEVEFVSVINDLLIMRKNVCICRHFHLLDKEAILKSNAREKMFIDIWPMNFFDPDETNVFDVSSLFLMQLATILNMVSTWSKKTLMRVFLCVSTQTTDQIKQEFDMKAKLSELRIQASIVTVNWDSLSSQIKHRETDTPSRNYNHISSAYLNGVNQFIRDHSINTAVSFLNLAAPPADEEQYSYYFKCLTMMTQHLHPTVLVHGVSTVTTTHL